MSELAPDGSTSAVRAYVVVAERRGASGPAEYFATLEHAYTRIEAADQWKEKNNTGALHYCKCFGYEKKRHGIVTADRLFKWDLGADLALDVF